MTGESTKLDVASDRRQLRLVIEYDGTDLAGWQRQAQGERTAQGDLEAALRAVLDDPGVRVVGAGRTDAGVHATGQVAHLYTRSARPRQAILAGTNTALGPDIQIREVAEAAPGFHARHSARAREYRYQIWDQGPLPPFLARYAHGERRALDVAAMDAAARHLEGELDLTSFQAAGCVARTPVRTVYRSSVERHGGLVVYVIEARGFLRHMVRIIVGTLIKVGRGRLPPEAMLGVLAARDRARADATAPPQGLFLHRIAYAPGRDLEGRADPVLRFDVSYS